MSQDLGSPLEMVLYRLFTDAEFPGNSGNRPGFDLTIMKYLPGTLGQGGSHFVHTAEQIIEVHGTFGGEIGISSKVGYIFLKGFPAYIPADMVDNFKSHAGKQVVLQIGHFKLFTVSP